MADQPQLLSPDHTGLDRAGWSRLGQIADATQSALQEGSAKQPNPAGMLLAEVIAVLQRDWHRLWHPLESLREWWGNQAKAGKALWDQGLEHGGPKGSDPTPPSKGPTLDGTWTRVRDQLFEAAKDPKADAQKVAQGIVSAIPPEHRAGISERLEKLSEIARLSAGMNHPPKIESAPVKPAREFGEPPPEPVAEPPLPDNVRLFPQRPERPVPPQPLPESPVATRAPTPAPQTQTKAKSR